MLSAKGKFLTPSLALCPLALLPLFSVYIK